MARLTPEQKEKARIDYEVHGLGVREVARKYDVSPASVSTWVKSGNWEAGKTEHLVEKKKSAIKMLHETEQQTKHLSPSVQISIDCEVQQRLEAEKIFVDAAKYNQLLANEVLQSMVSKSNEEDGETLRLMDLDIHSKITSKNKETVLGKQPDTQVNVQNNMPTKIIRTIVDPKND